MRSSWNCKRNQVTKNARAANGIGLKVQITVPPGNLALTKWHVKVK